MSLISILVLERETGGYLQRSLDKRWGTPWTGRFSIADDNQQAKLMKMIQ